MEIINKIDNIITCERTIALLRMQIVEQLKLQQEQCRDIMQLGLPEVMALMPFIGIMAEQENKNVEFSKKTIDRYQELKRKFEAAE